VPAGVRTGNEDHWTLHVLHSPDHSFLLRPRDGDFFDQWVPVPALAAVIATEVWNRTAARAAMVVAAILIQTAAILFFFAATGFLATLIPARLAVLVACLPLVGALTAWGQFRGFNRILRLHRKARVSSR
jgi:hypothetical protein